MLEHYYDLLHKDRYQELFGHLDIGKQRTEEANSYLVFRISFATLQSHSAKKFDDSLNGCVKAYIKGFLAKYREHPQCKPIFESFTEEKIDSEPDAINLFVSMTRIIGESCFRKKVSFLFLLSLQLYILVDEYDSPISNSLSEYRSTKATKVAGNDIKQSQFMRLFSAIKEQHTEGAIGRVYITGVCLITLSEPTGEVSDYRQISFDEEFDSMCGLTEKDITDKALQHLVPRNQMENVLKIMRANFEGYMFNSMQKLKLFNTTMSVFFLRNLQRKRRIPEGHDLLDRNALPSASTLSLLSSTGLTQSIFDKLLTRGFYGEHPIHQTLDTEQKARRLYENPSMWIAFLYYIGAVTQSRLPSGVTTGTHYVIPNQVVKSEYFDSMKSRLQLSDIDLDSFQVAITDLIETKNIRPLCELIQYRVLRYLKSNDLHAYEQDIKVLVLGLVNISGKKCTCLDNEYSMQYKKNADLVLIPSGQIHIECKNINTEEVILPDGTIYQRVEQSSSQEEWKLNWEERVRKAKIISGLSECHVRSLKLCNASKEIDSKSSNESMDTVQDAWNSLVLQTKINKQLLEQQLQKPVTSFALLRVGLYTLLHSEV